MPRIKPAAMNNDPGNEMKIMMETVAKAGAATRGKKF
jgi:hypothetical protein